MLRTIFRFREKIFMGNNILQAASRLCKEGGGNPALVGLDPFGMSPFLFPVIRHHSRSQQCFFSFSEDDLLMIMVATKISPMNRSIQIKDLIMSLFSPFHERHMIC